MGDALRGLLAKAVDDLSMDGGVDLIELERQCIAAAIARMGAGNDMVERLLENDREIFLPLLGEAAAHIAALTARVAEAREQRADAEARMETAEAERDALRERVARLEGVLTDMPKAVLRTTVCQGPQWPDDRPGVWLAALEACAKSVQAAVDAAISEGGKDG